jgi:poly(A) polymerase
VLLKESPLHIDLLPLRGPIAEDLLLRDYTVDALAASLSELTAGPAEVIDPTNGLPDLNSRLIRVVSEQALLDDPLRLLRGVRLAVQLGFQIEPGTAALIHSHRDLVNTAAPERQRDEILALLATDSAAQGLALLDNAGLLSLVMPELDSTRGVEQPKEHNWDVFGHSIQAVAVLDWLLLPSPPAREPEAALWQELWSQIEWWPEQHDYWREQLSPGISRASIMKLTALLHDIGKPGTKSREEGGRIRFFGHSETGAQVAASLLRRLRFPAKVTRHIKTMIEAHLRPLQMALEGAPSRRAVYRFFRDTAGAGPDTLFLSLADHLATVGPRVTNAGWRRHVAVVSFILNTHLNPPAEAKPVKLVEGEDLMETFGLPPGPLVGELLAVVREAQATGEITSREEAIELARTYWKKRHVRK